MRSSRLVGWAGGALAVLLVEVLVGVPLAAPEPWVCEPVWLWVPPGFWLWLATSTACCTSALLTTTFGSNGYSNVHGGRLGVLL